MSLDSSAVEHCRALLDAEVCAETPLFPGAVLAVADLADQSVSAHGQAVRFRSIDEELPAAEQIAMSTTTIFDLASLSKLFTTIVSMRLVERGVVDLARPVAAYLPEFDRTSVRRVTVRDLLAHTSGLPPFRPLWSEFPDPPRRVAGALTTEPETEPGTAYCYSDLNLIAMGELARRLDGRDLAEQVRDGIAIPLGLTDTGYCPDPALRTRVAATEDEHDTGRGLVWGEVHDENAWSLDGVAGHAGVFSTAGDLIRLGRCLLRGGVLDGHRILEQETVRLMMTDVTAHLGVGHGLGFELGRASFMGALAGPRTAGHTGFTGTSLVVDFDRGLIVVLLTNRVHPTRFGGSINPVRAAIGDLLA